MINEVLRITKTNFQMFHANFLFARNKLIQWQDAEQQCNYNQVGAGGEEIFCAQEMITYI